MRQNNSDRYNFSDFTTNNYRRLLEIAKSSYRFSDFRTIPPKSTSSSILWRHDVDVSPHRALKLAQIECDMGVTSTFFILLSSEFYNFHEREVCEKFQQIVSLGHRIGLHFDHRRYGVESETKLEQWLSFERKIIENVLGVSVDAFSFHVTSKETELYTKTTYSEMTNVYSHFLRNNYEYCSDSNGYWRFKRLEEFLVEKHDHIQVLTHPEYWTDQVMSPYDRIERCIAGRSNSVRDNFFTVVRNTGRIIPHSVDEEVQ